MNVQEATKLIAKIRVRYPNAYASFGPEDMVALRETLLEDFGHVPFAVVDAALRQFAANDMKGYPPTTGQLMKFIDQAAHPDDLSGPAAWQVILRAARCDPEQARIEYNNLSPVLQRTIGGPGFLVELGHAEAESNSVRQSLFERAYRVEMEREVEKRKTAPDALKLLEGHGEEALPG